MSESIEKSSKELSNLVPVAEINTLSSGSSEDIGRAPTEEELQTLRHVSAPIPFACYLVALVEVAERFTYYGISAPFQNYMQRTMESSIPGKLGLGSKGANGLSYFFQFWCYICPILGAYLSDTFWGKYKTIFVFTVVDMVGITILFATSFESVSVTGSLAGFIIGIILIGLGSGGIKSSVSPLIAEQIDLGSLRIGVDKKGNRVVIDPNITVETVFMLFYLCINVGSLSLIATTSLELHVGFWAAYLLPLCFFFVGVAALVFGRHKYVKKEPTRSVIQNAFKITFIGIKNWDLDAAKNRINWSNKFVDEVGVALKACKVFVFFPIYWVVYGQMVSNFVFSASQMELHGLPNDIMQNINPLTLIVFIPICNKLLYPFLRKINIKFKPITKIFWGFVLGSSAMLYAAVLQHFIYNTGPCYENPLCGADEMPNHIHVAIQTPLYLLIGLSEIFASITGLEYAYTKAPSNLKSFIMAIFLFTSAVGAALGIALSPTAENPKLVWTYTGLSVACFVAGLLFWVCFKHYNTQEESMNAVTLQIENSDGQEISQKA